MRVVNTLNSIYEIDESAKLIRRLSGANAPTERQGEDGEWKAFVAIAIADKGMLIQWGTNPDGTLKCTWTSKIISEGYSNAIRV